MRDPEHSIQQCRVIFLILNIKLLNAYSSVMDPFVEEQIMEGAF